MKFREITKRKLQNTLVLKANVVHFELGKTSSLRFELISIIIRLQYKYLDL